MLIKYLNVDAVLNLCLISVGLFDDGASFWQPAILFTYVVLLCVVTGEGSEILWVPSRKAGPQAGLEVWLSVLILDRYNVFQFPLYAPVLIIQMVAVNAPH